MAKRFTDSDKWKKRWFRQSTKDMKLFWLYLLDNCNHAGIYEVDIETASHFIGSKIKESDILKNFKSKIIQIDEDKWFIPKFIEFQYGILNENVNAHKSVIKILEKYKLDKPIEQLPNSCPTDLYMDKDQDKDKNKNKDNKKKGKKEQLEEIKANFGKYSKDYPHLNIEWYFESFVDYLDSKDKRYSNYSSAFKNCCRQEWYKDRPGSTKISKSSSSKIILACPSGHHKRESQKGIRAVCPECREQLLPLEQIQLNRATA